MSLLPSPLFLLLPLGLMVVVPLILRSASGWAALARFYRAKQPYSGSSAAFGSGSLNWVNFNNCLILGADSAGLFVSVFFPFTLAFPPLLIPWSDITATPKQGVFLRIVAFQFAQAPKVTFSVLEHLGRELLSARPAADQRL